MIDVSYLLFALFISTGLAYLGNRGIQSLGGDRSLFIAVPWWEEACKTGAAIYFGVPVVAVHAAFGFTEMLYDWLRPSSTGLLLGSLSMTGHLTFGILTWAAAAWTGSVWVGYCVAALLHMGWNRVMVRLVSRWQAPGARGGEM